jgi:large repetitive protein
MTNKCSAQSYPPPPPPLNDNCAGATPIAIGASGSSTTVRANVAGATFGYLENRCFAVSGPPGVWFTFVGTGERMAIVTQNSRDEARFALLQGAACDSDTASSLTCVTSGRYLSLYTVPLTIQTVASRTYYLVVQATLDFTLIRVPNSKASNDACVKATVMSIGSTVTPNFTFVPANQDLVREDCILGSLDDKTLSKPGLWYSFIGTGGRIAILGTARIGKFWALSVYQGTCGNGGLSCVAGDNLVESLTLSTKLNTTYYVHVRRTSFDSDPVDLSLSNAISIPNDACAEAINVSMGVRFRGNMTFATLDDKEAPLRSCNAQDEGRGVWFSFTGTGGRVTAVSECRGAFVANYVSVYKGTCGISTLQCHADFGSSCNDKAPFTFNTEAGITYYLLVQSRYFLDPVYDMTLVSAPLDIDDNDVCSKSQRITFGTSVLGNITLATSDETDVTSDCSGGNVTSSQQRGLWFSFVGTGGRVWVQACGMPMQISVYKGSSCGKTTLQCVAENQNACFDKDDFCSPQKFIFTTQANVTYYILVRNTNDPISSIFTLQITNVDAVGTGRCRWFCRMFKWIARLFS